MSTVDAMPRGTSERSILGRSDGDDQYSHLTSALLLFAGLATDDPRRGELLAELVESFRPLTRHVAQRYGGRGEPLDDLEQVAAIGLMNALSRFDPARGSDFLAYAIPTMLGEVRRHFRDRTWAVRAPRGLKERGRQVDDAKSALMQVLWRPPTLTDLAGHLGLRRSDVHEAAVLNASFRPISLDEPLSDATDYGLSLMGVLGTDGGFEATETRVALSAIVRELPERERAILFLRFFRDRTQAEIGATIGISQMHVSRLLTQILALLRERLQTTGVPPQ